MFKLKYGHNFVDGHSKTGFLPTATSNVSKMLTVENKLRKMYHIFCAHVWIIKPVVTMEI